MKLEKEQIKPELSKTKVVRIKEKSMKLKIKNQQRKINKTKSWFFEKNQ